MPAAKIVVRRIVNLQRMPLGLFVDGKFTEKVGWKTIRFDVKGGMNHLIQVGYKNKSYSEDSHNMHFESGKEYYFEFGYYIDGNGKLNLDYHGHEWDESNAAPIKKGFTAVKKLFK